MDNMQKDCRETKMEDGRPVREALHKWSRQKVLPAWFRAGAVDMTKVGVFGIYFEGEIH